MRIGKISFITRVFNLKESEWPRVIFAWAIRVAYTFGFVMGWTLMIALFVGHFGILSLPYLFILNAFFVIMGTFFYSVILDYVDHEYILSFNLLMAILSLFVGIYFLQFGEMYLFSFLLFAAAIFLSQFRILFLGHVEDMFTPMESERTFPLIEAAETVGGVLAGLVIVFFADFIGNIGIIYLWIASLFFIFLVLNFGRHFSEKPAVEIFNTHGSSRGKNILSKVKYLFARKTQRRYIFGLLLIVFLNWFMFNLLEFQYTKAVYNKTSVILSGGSGFENIFIKDLGTLFTIFSSAALLVQLFLASRLIESIGVVGSMILHPIVNLFSFIGMLIFPGFQSAVFMKTNFCITNVVNHDAYHSSYYAVDKEARPLLHEVGEGLVRPLGAIFGTGVLLILNFVFPSEYLSFSVNIALIVVAVLLLFSTFFQQKRYFLLAKFNLANGKSLEDRLEAVEILSQRGEKKYLNFLNRYLENEEEVLAVRLKVIESFGSLKSLAVIDFVLRCLDSKKMELKKAVLDLLEDYGRLGVFNSQVGVLLQGKVINCLKKLYQKDEAQELRVKIIELMGVLHAAIAFDYILEILKSAPISLKDDAIFALKGLNDEKVVEEVLPYLDARNLRVRICAAIVLFEYDDYREKARAVFKEYLRQGNSSRKLSFGLFAVGELGLDKKYCEKALNEKSDFVKIEAHISLLKLGEFDYLDDLVDLLFELDDEKVFLLKSKFKNFVRRFSRGFDKKFRRILTTRIKELMGENEMLIEIEEEDLLMLKRIYVLAEEYAALDNIEEVLKCEVK